MLRTAHARIKTERERAKVVAHAAGISYIIYNRERRGDESCVNGSRSE